MNKMISRFLKDEDGATAIEYGLIIALISLAIVAGVGALADQLEFLWGDNNSEVNKVLLK